MLCRCKIVRELSSLRSTFHEHVLPDAGSNEDIFFVGTAGVLIQRVRKASDESLWINFVCFPQPCLQLLLICRRNKTILSIMSAGHFEVRLSFSLGVEAIRWVGFEGSVHLFYQESAAVSQSCDRWVIVPRSLELSKSEALRLVHSYSVSVRKPNFVWSSLKLALDGWVNQRD